MLAGRTTMQGSSACTCICLGSTGIARDTQPELFILTASDDHPAVIILSSLWQPWQDWTNNSGNTPLTCNEKRTSPHYLSRPLLSLPPSPCGLRHFLVPLDVRSSSGSGSGKPANRTQSPVLGSGKSAPNRTKPDFGNTTGGRRRRLDFVLLSMMVSKTVWRTR